MINPNHSEQTEITASVSVQGTPLKNEERAAKEESLFERLKAEAREKEK